MNLALKIKKKKFNPPQNPHPILILHDRAVLRPSTSKLNIYWEFQQKIPTEKPDRIPFLLFGDTETKWIN